MYFQYTSYKIVHFKQIIFSFETPKKVDLAATYSSLNLRKKYPPDKQFFFSNDDICNKDEHYKSNFTNWLFFFLECLLFLDTMFFM